MLYLHEYISFQNLSLSEFIKLVKETESIVIADLKFKDLFLHRKTFVGIYVFYNPESQPVYIGKTGGRGLIERLGAHFDLRPSAFMNHFLIKLAWQKLRKKKSELSAEEVEDIFWESIDYRLAFFNINNLTQMTLVEIALQKNITGLLNSCRRRRIFNLDSKVSDLN